MMIIGTLLISVLMVAVVPNVITIFESMDQVLPWYTAPAHLHERDLAQLLVAARDGPRGTIYGFRALEEDRAGSAKLARVAAQGAGLRQALLDARHRALRAHARDAARRGRAAAVGDGHRANVLGNAVLEKVVADAIGNIREGQSIAEPLKRAAVSRRS
jgi:general secretion pathway protein F